MGLNLVYQSLAPVPSAPRAEIVKRIPPPLGWFLADMFRGKVVIGENLKRLPPQSLNERTSFVFYRLERLGMIFPRA
jgi:hypothetical protein